MGNFKVKVRAETKEQSDEIQKLANSIGIFRNYSNWVLHKGWVCLDGNEILLVCDSCLGGEEDFKTITLAELRAMVNPSLKDQYLEQEKKINDACASVFKKQDDLLTAMLDHSAMSINDQYAEIEKVRQASKDNVNNPQHYNKGGVECIDAIEASMTPEAFKGYLKGNVQKYMWRYEQKGGVESLRKAQWYLERLVASMDS